MNLGFVISNLEFLSWFRVCKWEFLALFKSVFRLILRIGSWICGLPSLIIFNILFCVFMSIR